MTLDRLSLRPASRRLRAVLGLGALATAVAVAACSSDATTSPTTKSISPLATAYLDTALTFEADVDYWWANVDSVAQRNDVFKVAGNAQTYKDTWAAVDTSIDPWLVNADPAKDYHSAFFPNSEAPGVVNSPSDSRYLAQGSNLTLSGTTNAGYLWMPTYDGTNDLGRADSIQTVIRTLDQQSPCGWIIDLRYNPGGTWAAMLSGINPILGNQPYGNGQQGFMGIVDRYGFKSYLFVANARAGLVTPAQTASGQYYAGDSAIYDSASSNYTLKRPNSPVAILQGGYTASAGEEIVLAFRGVSFPVRTFGTNTYGVTTAPYGLYMPDTSYLNIVGAIDFDRTGQTWGGSIPPTVTVSGPAPANTHPATSTSSDPVVQAASQWLQTQSSCGGTATTARSQVPGPTFSLSPVAPALAASRTGTPVRGRVPRQISRIHVARAPRSRLRALALGSRVH